MWPQALLPLPPVDRTPLTTISTIYSEQTHHSGNIMPPSLAEQAQCAAAQHATWCIQQIVAHCLMIITVLYAMIITPADPEPYHTSILSSKMWVQELLNGHPDHILCELGVWKEVFKELICTLHNIGTMDSKYVSLEEQLAIFLYISVMGLTIRHTGEWFQHSNDTISKCFLSSCQVHFIQTTSTFQMPIPPPREKYITVTRCGHFSDMH